MNAIKKLGILTGLAALCSGCQFDNKQTKDLHTLSESINKTTRDSVFTIYGILPRLYKDWPPTPESINREIPYRYIECIKVDYETLQPINNRGELTRYYKITVPNDYNLEKLVQELSRLENAAISVDSLCQQNKIENSDLIHAGATFYFKAPTKIISGTYIMSS